MKVQASAKNVRITPRKVRLVLDQVRGLSVDQAQRVLAFLPNKGAEPVLKLINSAAANAEHNYKLDRKNLYVAQIQAGAGLTIKRFRPRAFGRAAMIRKATSHLTVVLEEKADAKAEAGTSKGKGKAAKAKPGKAAAAKAEAKPVAAKTETAAKPAPKAAAKKPATPAKKK